MIIKLRNTTIVVANVQYERSNQIQQFKFLSFDDAEAKVGSNHDCHNCHNSSLDITLDKTKRWVIVNAEL